MGFLGIGQKKGPTGAEEVTAGEEVQDDGLEDVSQDDNYDDGESRPTARARASAGPFAKFFGSIADVLHPARKDPQRVFLGPEDAALLARSQIAALLNDDIPDASQRDDIFSILNSLLQSIPEDDRPVNLARGGKELRHLITDTKGRLRDAKDTGKEHGSAIKLNFGPIAAAGGDLVMTVDFADPKGLVLFETLLQKTAGEGLEGRGIAPVTDGEDGDGARVEGADGDDTVLGTDGDDGEALPETLDGAFTGRGDAEEGASLSAVGRDASAGKPADHRARVTAHAPAGTETIRYTLPAGVGVDDVVGHGKDHWKFGVTDGTLTILPLQSGVRRADLSEGRSLTFIVKLSDGTSVWHRTIYDGAMEGTGGGGGDGKRGMADADAARDDDGVDGEEMSDGAPGLPAGELAAVEDGAKKDDQTTSEGGAIPTVTAEQTAAAAFVADATASADQLAAMAAEYRTLRDENWNNKLRGRLDLPGKVSDNYRAASVLYRDAAKTAADRAEHNRAWATYATEYPEGDRPDDALYSFDQTKAELEDHKQQALALIAEGDKILSDIQAVDITDVNYPVAWV